MGWMDNIFEVAGNTEWIKITADRKEWKDVKEACVQRAIKEEDTKTLKQFPNYLKVTNFLHLLSDISIMKIINFIIVV